MPVSVISSHLGWARCLRGRSSGGSVSGALPCNRGCHPASQERTQLLALAGGTAGIDYQGLKNSQHELDNAIHIVIGDAHAAPVDVEPLKQGAPERHRSIG